MIYMSVSSNAIFSVVIWRLAVHGKAVLVFYQRVRNFPLILGICVAGGQNTAQKQQRLLAFA
jgi:hypothetical protein